MYILVRQRKGGPQQNLDFCRLKAALRRAAFTLTVNGGASERSVYAAEAKPVPSTPDF